ncbi:hypothetical protein K7432_002395 [Basidiobolus ranarum]|uniref:Uncharacterized protein n=1 Tax=Basidiobolus ranarum TaxID=34480 RepID=A0ABR2W7Y7_9FUNG
MPSKTPRKTSSENHFGTPKTGLPTLVSPPVSSRLRSRNRRSVRVEPSETLTPLSKQNPHVSPSKTLPVKRVSEQVETVIKTPKTTARKSQKSTKKTEEVIEAVDIKNIPTDESPETPTLVSPPLVKRLRSHKKSEVRGGRKSVDTPVTTIQNNKEVNSETPVVTKGIQKNLLKSLQKVESEDSSKSPISNDSKHAKNLWSVKKSVNPVKSQSKEEVNMFEASASENESADEPEESVNENQSNSESEEEEKEEDVEISKETNEPSDSEESDSDDDAPEAVSLSSGKSMALQAKKQEREAIQKIADQQKQKRREADSKLKEQKAAKKDRSAKKPLPLIEVEEVEVPKPLEIPTTLPLDMLEMVADMDEKPSKKRNHIQLDEIDLEDDVPKSKKIKGEKTFGAIKVISLTSQPKAKLIPESISDFKSNHFFGSRVNRKNAVLNVSQKRNVAVKFRRS